MPDSPSFRFLNAIAMVEFSDTGASATDSFIGEPRMALYDLHVQASTSEAIRTESVKLSL